VFGYPHVFDGATESVRDASIVNRLLTEAEVSQLDVSLEHTKHLTSITQSACAAWTLKHTTASL